MSPSSVIVPLRSCEGLRLDDAAVVDHRPQQAAGRLRGHQHLAAVGAHQPAVRDQRVDRALVDGDVEQAVARRRRA